MTASLRPPFDLVIRRAELVDGTRAPRRRADLGLRDGRIAAIGSADLVVFDPGTLALGAERYVRDVPSGARRSLRDAVGIDAVLVAGEPIVLRGEYREARRGRLV